MRKDSIGSIGKIYGGQERIESSTRSPKQKKSKAMKKRNSKGSLNKSKENIPKSKNKLKIK